MSESETHGVDFVRGAAALKCRSPFAAQVLATNCDIGPAALDKWLQGHARLAPAHMALMVRELFHDGRQWDHERQCLVDA